MHNLFQEKYDAMHMKWPADSDQSADFKSRLNLILILHVHVHVVAERKPKKKSAPR